MSSTKPRRAPIEKPTAIPRTETGKVAHPTLDGHIEIVHRVVDTIEGMRKRKQLSEREYQAADYYRTCWETIHSSIGGAMDYDRARGGSLPGQPPAPHYMLASEVCSEVRRVLYPQDFAVVHRVCALGMTVEQAAANLYQQTPTRAQKEDCGRRLREGLGQLAERWFPEHRGRGNNMRSQVMEKAGVTEVETVPQGRAVHATSEKVYRSGR